MTFLVIGAQKCATSWLYLCLREHPHLHLPDRKKEVEYLGGDLHRENGDDWYLRLISSGAPPDSIRGDVSVEYLWDPASPQEVARLLPDSCIMVSLRDPVERAVSAFYWYQRKDRLPGTLTLADALDQGRAWLTEVGEADVPPPGVTEELVARGRYDVQLSRWLARFPPEKLLVLDYRQIEESPLAALERVHRFLGVAPHHPHALTARPKRNLYSASFVRLERLFPRARIWSGLLDRAQRRWPGRARMPLERIPGDLREGLYDAFRPGMRRTAALLDTLPASNRPANPSFAPSPDRGA